MTIQYEPIGVIRSPFKSVEGMPIQPAGAAGAKGEVEVLSKYQPGLKDLGGFSHIVLLYHLHKSEQFDLQVIPFLDTERRGLFATRAPRRPNPIGLSVVRLLRIEGNLLQIENVDILDGTPLLDIKPHVPAFDEPTDIRTGWLEKAARSASDKRSDDRFTKEPRDRGKRCGD